MKKYVALLLCALLLLGATAPLNAQPAAASANTLYVFDLESFINGVSTDSKVQYDYLKLATALQGLVNRDTPQLYFLFKTNGFAQNLGEDMDQYWYDKLTEPGEYLAGFTRQTVTDFWWLVEHFSAAYGGLVLWDEEVPATANVASTIAGVENLLPVRYDTAAGSLYKALLGKGFTQADIKKNLVGMFTGSGTIPGSSTPSTGSAKNDAYLWAKENYLDTGKTSADLMAYTLDGFTWATQTSKPALDGAFVAADLPERMVAGATVPVTVTVENTGASQAWAGAGRCQLARSANTGAFTLADPLAPAGVQDRAYIAASKTVKAGELYTFTFSLTAPASPGTYDLGLGMVKDGAIAFGDSYTASIEVLPRATIDQARNAQILYTNLPSQMKAGATYDGMVAVRNTGTESWREIGGAQAGYRLGLTGDSAAFRLDNTNGDANVHNRAFIDAGKAVSAGEIYCFHFTITAPAAAGTHTLKLQMVLDGVSYYGGILTKAITVTGSGTAPSLSAQARDGDFLSADIPARMTAGSTATVRVEVRNTGTAETWTETNLYRLGRLAGKDDFALVDGNGDYAPRDRVRLQANQAVAPGTTHTFTFQIVAPTTPGTYELGLGFVKDGVAYFGEEYLQTIEVAADYTVATNLDGKVVSTTIPAQMEAGKSEEVTVAVRNTGAGESWNAASLYRLGRAEGSANFPMTSVIGDGSLKDRAFIESGITVRPGDLYFFQCGITAPAATGAQTLKLRMVKDGVTWFGDTFSKSVTVVAKAQRDAAFLKAKLPTRMQAGATAEVEVTVRNDGTNTWQEFGGSQAGYRLGRTGDSASFRFDNSNGDANVHDRAFIDTGRTVPANGSYTFTFTITAPAQTGAKVLELRMVHDGVAWFGDTYSWNIEVVSGAGSDPERVIIAPESLIRYPDLMNTALPNADYYVAKKAFFWDLSPDAAIAPIDDRSQPLGTDVATLQKLLRAQACRAGNSIYTVSGFVPWHLKYTSYADPLSNMDPVPSEWKMIDIISAYHGQLDADAMGMVGLSNASVFSKVPLNSNLTQSNDKGAGNTLTYRADTDYIMFYMGDFDAGAWTSGCLPLLWDDPKRGELPLAWPVCADLANRVPQVFNYLYETAGENDYFVSGDNGTGYLNPMFLEGDKVPSGMSNFLNVWKAHNIASNERFDIDITGFLIAGNAGSITPTVQAAYHEISPQGVVYQGSVSQAVYQGTPFAPYWDIGGEIKAASADSVADNIHSRLQNQGQFHCFRSVLTQPSRIVEIVNSLRTRYPNQKFEVVDPYTFMKFFKQANS